MSDVSPRRSLLDQQAQATSRLMAARHRSIKVNRAVTGSIDEVAAERDLARGVTMQQASRCSGCQPSASESARALRRRWVVLRCDSRTIATDTEPVWPQLTWLPPQRVTVSIPTRFPISLVRVQGDPNLFLATGQESAGTTGITVNCGELSAKLGPGVPPGP
jgi:hypothetical protein